MSSDSGSESSLPWLPSAPLRFDSATAAAEDARGEQRASADAGGSALFGAPLRLDSPAPERSAVAAGVTAGALVDTGQFIELAGIAHCSR